MRLIDAEELNTILDEESQKDWSLPKALLIGFAKQILNDAPTVDAEPIRHGHWEDDGQRFGSDNKCAIYECDQCGETIWVYLKDHRRWSYCPQCGSKMSEEVYIKLKRKDEVTE